VFARVFAYDLVQAIPPVSLHLPKENQHSLELRAPPGKFARGRPMLLRGILPTPPICYKMDLTHLALQDPPARVVAIHQTLGRILWKSRALTPFSLTSPRLRMLPIIIRRLPSQNLRQWALVTDRSSKPFGRSCDSRNRPREL